MMFFKGKLKPKSQKKSRFPDIKGIPLKKAPYYKKAPPCYVPIWNKGGGFLKFNSGRRPAKILGYFALKTSIFKAKTVQKACKKLKIFACGALWPGGDQKEV